MYYFIGNTFGATITGIEKALINRLKLFLNHQVNARLIFLSWNPNTTIHARNHNIENKVFTMYDYFQESTFIHNYTSKDWISYWQEEQGFKVRYVENSTDVRIYNDKNQFLMYAHFHDHKYSKLGYINYFNKSREKIKRELYDIRGFLSCTKNLINNKTLSEFFYTPHGKIIIEKYYDISKDNNPLTHIIVKDFKQKTYHFNSERELIALFYEDIYKDGDMFFSDKAIATAIPFTMINKKIPVVSVLHSTHTKDNFDVEKSEIKNIYSPIFNHLERFKAIIVSTEQQRIDVEKRIKNLIPIYNIPVGYLENKRVVNERSVPKHHKLISIARLESEKQLYQQIHLVNKLKNDFPDIELHIFGHGSEKNKLSKLISELKIEKHVMLRGFSRNIISELKDANISLITSHTEGFSLALLESLSQGVPCISYDINYGPSELIKHGENGFLIPFNDEDKLYEYTKKLLNDSDLQQKMVNNSLSYSKRYNEDDIFNQWKQFLINVNGQSE